MQTMRKLAEANNFMIEEFKHFNKGRIPQVILEEKNEFMKNKMLFDFLHANYLERLEKFEKEVC